MSLQPFNQTYEAASPPTVHSSTIFYQNGVPYTFHNGVAYFPATPPQHASAGAITTAGDPAGMYQSECHCAVLLWQTWHLHAVLVIWLWFVPATYGPPPAAPTHSPGAATAAAYPVIYPCTAPPTMYMTPQQFQYQPMPVSLCYFSPFVWHVLSQSVIRLGTEPQISWIWCSVWKWSCLVCVLWGIFIHVIEWWSLEIQVSWLSFTKHFLVANAFFEEELGNMNITSVQGHQREIRVIYSLFEQ
jgi:hypothetical protein